MPADRQQHTSHSIISGLLHIHCIAKAQSRCRRQICMTHVIVWIPSLPVSQPTIPATFRHHNTRVQCSHTWMGNPNPLFTLSANAYSTEQHARSLPFLPMSLMTCTNVHSGCCAKTLCIPETHICTSTKHAVCTGVPSRVAYAASKSQQTLRDAEAHQSTWSTVCLRQSLPWAWVKWKQWISRNHLWKSARAVPSTTWHHLTGSWNLLSLILYYLDTKIYFHACIKLKTPIQHKTNARSTNK